MAVIIVKTYICCFSEVVEFLTDINNCNRSLVELKRDISGNDNVRTILCQPEETFSSHIFHSCEKCFSVVGGFAVGKMAEAEAVDVEKKNEDWEAKEEEKSQEELIKESIAAAVMKVLIQSCGL